MSTICTLSYLISSDPDPFSMPYLSEEVIILSDALTPGFRTMPTFLQ
jgi:hypothetical protein